MRAEFCDALIAHARNPNVIFLTGDLGFMALEPLRQFMHERFINAGVAEQNMISVAAALARQELDVWVYSIAPFCYGRAFEQIRNDISFHGLPVKIVGNGGGYGYGVMGPTHHAIEDYGVLLTLPNLKVFVPVFDQDMAAVVRRAAGYRYGSYLRMGRGEPPKDWPVPTYAPWRQLTEGKGPAVIAVGPLAGSYVADCNSLESDKRPNLWAISELPLAQNPLPDALVNQMHATGNIVVAEEHVKQGSFGADLALHCMERGWSGLRILHLFATSHHFARYGSQGYMRREAGLDAGALIRALRSLEK